MNNKNFNIQKNKESYLEVLGDESSKGAGFAAEIFMLRDNFASKGSRKLLSLFFEKLSKGKTSEKHELKEVEKSVVEK